jgi:hypothetical protein
LILSHQFLPSLAFTIHPQDPNEPPAFYPSPLLRVLTRDEPTFPISAQLIYTKQKNPVGNFTGKIVIYEQHYLQPKYAGCDALRDSGVAGVILQLRYTSFYPGYGDSEVPSGYKPRHPFPVFEITLAQNKTLAGWFKNQTKGVFITMENDPNPWKNTRAIGVPTLALVVLTTAGIILIMATYKLTMLILRDGLCWSLGQLVLIFNILALVTRILWAASNPFGAYNTTSIIWVQVSLTLPFPFVQGGALLIALYWHEMIQRTNTKINLFLNKMKWPFVIMCVLMFGFELAGSICRALGVYPRFVFSIYVTSYVVVTAALLIFFLTTICRLHFAFKTLNKTLSQSKKNKLKMASHWILGMSVTMIIWIPVLLVMVITDLIRTPTGFLVLFSLRLISLNLMILFQVMLIRAPRRSWKWIFFGLCITKSDSLLDIESEPLPTSAESHSNSRRENK